MSTLDGESLPEPDPEPSPYQDALFDAHNDLQIYPPYPRYVSDNREFEVRLFDDYDHIEIEATIYGELVKEYVKLDYEERFDLEKRIVAAMGDAALSLVGDKDSVMPAKKPTALVNNLPVLFEPINHAMLVGEWGDDLDKKKMTIRSEFIQDRDQQRILLGGLAAFVTYLEQR